MNFELAKIIVLLAMAFLAASVGFAIIILAVRGDL